MRNADLPALVIAAAELSVLARYIFYRLKAQFAREILFVQFESAPGEGPVAIEIFFQKLLFDPAPVSLTMRALALRERLRVRTTFISLMRLCRREG